MQITKKEIESCFPSTIVSKRISFDYNCWEIRFYMDYCNFVLHINCSLVAITGDPYSIQNFKFRSFVMRP